MSPTPSDLPASPTPGGSLRDQIENKLRGGPKLSLLTPGDVTDAVLTVVVPFITDLPSVPLDAPCVECGETFEPGDRVSWRLRYAPQGLIHEECR